MIFLVFLIPTSSVVRIDGPALEQETYSNRKYVSDQLDQFIRIMYFVCTRWLGIKYALVANDQEINIFTFIFHRNRYARLF